MVKTSVKKAAYSVLFIKAQFKPEENPEVYSKGLAK